MQADQAVDKVSGGCGWDVGDAGMVGIRNA